MQFNPGLVYLFVVGDLSNPNSAVVAFLLRNGFVNVQGQGLAKVRSELTSEGCVPQPLEKGVDITLSVAFMVGTEIRVPVSIETWRLPAIYHTWECVFCDESNAEEQGTCLHCGRGKTEKKA